MDLRASLGRDVREVEQILDRERHTGERAWIATGLNGGIDLCGSSQRAFGCDVGESVDVVVAFGDVRKRHFDNGSCRLRPAPNAAGNGQSGVGTQGLNTGAGLVPSGISKASNDAAIAALS